MSSPQVKLIPFAGNSSGPSNVCNTFCSSHFAKEMHQHCTFIKATPAAHSRPKNKSGNRVKLVPPAEKKRKCTPWCMQMCSQSAVLLPLGLLPACCHCCCCLGSFELYLHQKKYYLSKLDQIKEFTYVSKAVFLVSLSMTKSCYSL